MKLRLNGDYAKRHLFVTVLMLGLSLWFGYDGFVRYPSLPPADLYRSIEKSDPPPALDLDAFKRQKTQTQYGFTALTLLAALVVGLRLLKAAELKFTFDKEGFNWNGRAFRRDDIVSIDRRDWEKKSILVLNLKGGQKLALDGWHHLGVKDFYELYSDERNHA